MDLHGIIVAVATPPGHSPRGMIRASGDGVFALLRTLAGDGTSDVGGAAGPVDAPGAAEADGATRRRVRAARIRLSGLDLAVLVASFPGPRSYTGQDVVELQLPGNPALLARCVDGLIAAGAEQGFAVRTAGPGEFTARAFFSGRLSLDQAEGVAATIAAGSDAELHAARVLAAGTLGVRTRALAEELLGALALVEAGIDFTDEEDVVAITPAALDARLVHLVDELDLVLRRGVGTEAPAAAPWVVLRGPPNAGKSTLFNALLGRHRSVISMHAGTTRDVIIEPMQLPGPGAAEIMLADAAGESTARSPLDDAMQAAAGQAQDRADLVLRCVPPERRGAGLAPTHSDELIVFTKSDQEDPVTPPPAGAVAVSAQTGRGLAELRVAIAARLAVRTGSLGAHAMALQPRHEAALREARQALEATRRVVSTSAGVVLVDAELVAASMREALDALGAVTGAMPADDVLERIFGSFCIGK